MEDSEGLAAWEVLEELVGYHLTSPVCSAEQVLVQESVPEQEQTLVQD